MAKKRNYALVRETQTPVEGLYLERATFSLQGEGEGVGAGWEGESGGMGGPYEALLKDHE